MILTSHILGTTLLALEGFLAFMAFGGLTNDCKDGYPCKVQDLFNKNFLDIPFIG
jgi:hypothetical protein